MIVKKRGVSFNVDDDDEYSCNWFRGRYDGWEEGTFDVLDRFLGENSIYIDVGAWIGPTVLYAAAKCARVYCFEPDPVAYSRLERNIANNPQYSQIEAYNFGISSAEGLVPFGGNGELGNSESTLLVSDEAYIQTGGSDSHYMDYDPAWRMGEVVEARMTTLKSFVECECIDMRKVDLVKVDIEGGEKIVIPSMAELLVRCETSLYLSLHWCFVSHRDGEQLLDTIFDVYSVARKPDMSIITRNEIVETHATELVFSHI